MAVFRHAHLFLMGMTRDPKNHETLSTQCHVRLSSILIFFGPSGSHGLG